MPSLALLRVVLGEVTSREAIRRTPEPNLVMDNPDQVVAFNEAGRETGVMAPVYLFHAAQICDVLRPGDRALDLACGPANQLALVAHLWPDVTFIGIDLSDEILSRADSQIREAGLTNVELQNGDIANLSEWETNSVDAVLSTMSLHHLPDETSLQTAFEEVARVLKPEGGLYLVDFGRLRQERSLQYFAHQYTDRQPEAFTQDYLNSLRAAFSREDFRKAGATLEGRARFYTTFLMPYMMAWKSPSRGELNSSARKQLEAKSRELNRDQQRDLQDLRRFFRLGGLTSWYLD